TNISLLIPISFYCFFFDFNLESCGFSFTSNFSLSWLLYFFNVLNHHILNIGQSIESELKFLFPRVLSKYFSKSTICSSNSGFSCLQFWMHKCFSHTKDVTIIVVAGGKAISLQVQQIKPSTLSINNS